MKPEEKIKEFEKEGEEGFGSRPSFFQKHKEVEWKDVMKKTGITIIIIAIMFIILK